MATPAQIAARKKFAERARSGELAKMRKKATRKSNPMVISKQADSSLSRYGSRGYIRKMLDDYSDLGHVVAVREKRTGGLSISLDGGRALTPEQARKKLEDFFGYAKNPAQTVSEEISQQMRKGKPQKQAVAIALEMERAGKLKKNPSTNWRIPEGDDKYIFDPYGRKGLTIVAEKTIKEDGYASVDLSIIYNEPKGVYQYAHGGVIEKEHTPSEVTAKRLATLWYEMNKEDFRAARRNPTATRATRSRTKSVSNGREKNPKRRVRVFDLAGTSVPEYKVAYSVHLADQSSRQGLAYFTKKADAIEAAQEIANRNNLKMAVSRVQIYFGISDAA